ncbi:hypothetical protein K458DRAFT_200974 [Lentithecium fluviatile CBS 122367]|uniref:Uncharacterized protein n=1 Tax=Lentithecium fluviatile CBS 122367 TaxID=1168545 RepID=A0A6G1J8Z7_9PLEO|nr:hypothetical protein K458DRAFT_200974 [Lentithecium fluviatile CBS 122367]
MASATRAARSAYRRKVFRGRQNGSRRRRTARDTVVQWWSYALPTRLHRGAGWSAKGHSCCLNVIGSLAHFTLSPGSDCSPLLTCRKQFEVLRSCFKFDKHRGTLGADVRAFRTC